MVYRRRSRRKLCSESLAQYTQTEQLGGLLFGDAPVENDVIVDMQIILLKDRKYQQLRLPLIQ